MRTHIAVRTKQAYTVVHSQTHARAASTLCVQHFFPMQ
jgi:hypothetical protein